MDGLVDDGFIIVGGPLGEGDRTLHVVEAAGEREIETRLGEDPWAVAGLWTAVTTGCSRPRPPAARPGVS